MKRITLFLVGTFISTLLNAQNVNIPNANFKNALLAHGATQTINGVQPITGSNISVIDTDGDGEISTAEALAYTGRISVYKRSISDLTGIEAFTALTELYCNQNQLTNLNVSSNTALIKLSCHSNQLTNLNVSANTALTELFCDRNKLTSLDVSANTALIYLGCSFNQITSLDVSTNTALVQLIGDQNKLTSLNVANGNNTTLELVYAQNNSGLTCIQHDASFDPTTNTNWRKDTNANWSNNCASASINDIAFSNTVTLYPNPVGNKLYISTENNNISSVEIYNVLGKKVLKANQEQVPVANLPSGMYIVKIQNIGGKVATKKFIKQ